MPLVQVLGFDLLKSGIFSVLPWITMAIFANLGGWLADTMVSKGVSVTRVRKIMQTVRPIAVTTAIRSLNICRSSIVVLHMASEQSNLKSKPSRT